MAHDVNTPRINALDEEAGGPKLATSSVFGAVMFPSGLLIIRGANGHGSTNTAIRRLNSTPSINVGGAFVYIDSATDGAAITIQRDCVVGYTYRDRRSTANSYEFGISLNSTQLTTSIATINSDTRIAFEQEGATSNFSEVSGIIKLSTGDVLRPHTNGALDETDARVEFRLTELYRLG